jgi:phage terminase large subunit GpA-like protein
MDAFFRDGSDVVLMKSSQVGATESLLNMLGCIVDHGEGPTMVVQPTIEMAKSFSKDRVDPMLRDTPCLRGRISDNEKDSDNTILHKRFEGGQLTIAGANSAANLRSRPIRNVLLDEIDAYPAHLDSVGLAIGRSKGFWNRRIFRASTPELKGSSRIEAAFEASNMQFYFVPCPHCGELQRLIWEQLRWQRELGDGRRVPAIDPEWKSKGRHLSATAVYVCEFCGAEIEHRHKERMLAAGEWRATAPASGVDGFHINELYSPHVTWAQMVEAFVNAKRLPESLKKFINESLGLSWEEQSEKHDPEGIKKRAEPYTKAPREVLIVTAAVDVQDDRLEVEAVGWSTLFESWSLEAKRFLGDPAFPDVWNELDDWHRTAIERDDGRLLPIACMTVDSGHHTDAVYRFCKKRFRRRVYAIKGVGGLGSGVPIVGRFTRNNRHRCPVLPVNVDQCKDEIFGWLSIEDSGPGYMHFPTSHDDEYFYQLTAEERVERMVKGQKVRAYVQRRARNEALDLRVYNRVAIEIIAPKWPKLTAADAAEAAMSKGRTNPDPPAGPRPPPPPNPPPPPRVRRMPRQMRSNWVNSW